MTYRIRTTDPFPRYLEAAYNKPSEAIWTRPDTSRWTGEDRAMEYNIIEAEALVKEFQDAGISVEIC